MFDGIICTTVVCWERRMTSRVAASAPKVTSSRGHNCAISQQVFVQDEAEDDGDGNGDRHGDRHGDRDGQTEERTEEQTMEHEEDC